jgi:hypothetical protein
MEKKQRRKAMSRACRGLVVGGLSLLICLCLAPVARAAQLAAGWAATLAISPTTVLPGEPVLATCALTYTGEETFSGYASFGRAAVHYTGPCGEAAAEPVAAPVPGGASGDTPPAKPARYRRGFSLVTTLPLLYAGKGFLFAAEGTGQLELRAEIWQGPGLPDYQRVAVSCAPVTITVLPLPAEEAAAYDLWRDEQVARMFLTGDAAAETQAKVKRLTLDFPKSAYAKYALMALARQKRSLRERLGSGFLPPQQREEARRLAAREVELLEEARARDPEGQTAPLLLYQLLTAARWLSDSERQEKLPQYASALLALPDAPAPYREEALRTVQAVGAGAQGQTLIGSATPARPAAAPPRSAPAARPRPTPPPASASAPVRRTPT